MILRVTVLYESGKERTADVMFPDPEETIVPAVEGAVPFKVGDFYEDHPNGKTMTVQHLADLSMVLGGLPLSDEPGYVLFSFERADHVTIETLTYDD